MPHVPPGGLILVTGANGYIGGVTIQVFLDAGYKVRGTVRSIEKNKWMLQHYGPNFSLVEVPEMSVENAFDEAVKGVDGVAHVASSVVFKPDPQEVIPPMIKSAITILEAAAKEPKVKSVVYTSSQAACVKAETLYTGAKYSIKEWTYAEEVKAAWSAPQSSEFPRMLLNYACSKLEAEQASWNWVKEHKPHFTFNTVVPNVNFGPTSSPGNTGMGSSAGLLKLLWNGLTLGTSMIPPEWMIDVADTGRLHLAALTLPDVENHRIMAMAYRFGWNDILKIFRETAPNKKFPDDLQEFKDQGTVEIEYSVELLKSLGQKDGFAPFELPIQNWIKQMQEIEEKNIQMPETESDRLAKMYS